MDAKIEFSIGKLKAKTSKVINKKTAKLLRKLPVHFIKVGRNPYLEFYNPFSTNFMKKLTPFLVSITVLFLAYSCGNDMSTRTVDNLYAIDVPLDMKSTTGLNPDASFQCENIHKETYLAIIDENKSDFEDAYLKLGGTTDSETVIGSYARIQIDYFMERLKTSKQGELEPLTINGMPAEQIEFTGHVADVAEPIYYLMTFVEGAENVYMIMTWTFDRFKDEHAATFKKMTRTFEELN